MYSKQFRKALSMVMVIAMIMSVCAVCFGTFGNAAAADPSFGVTYALDFADSPTYDSTAGGNLITMDTTQNTASVVVEGTRVLNKGYYGDPGAYMFDLIDKDVNLGSTDGHIVIEPGKKYNINIKVGRYADATHPNANGALFLSLAFVDASGKVFLATPVRADLANPSYNNNETWMKFGSGASSDLYSLVATIDGDAVQETVGKAYANCKLAVLCDVQPNKSGTVIVKSGTIEVIDESAKAYTVNFRRDSDNYTDYPETGGTGQAAVKTDLVWNYSGAGASYLHTDNIFRFCFAAQTAANDTTSDNYYPDPTHLYHVGVENEHGTGYEFFKVADPDLKTGKNTYGKVIIEEGKAYSFSVEVRANGWSSGGLGENYVWVTYGLYNPKTNSVYPLPYDASTLTATGADSFIYATPSNAWPSKTITISIDSATMGPDNNPYAGCELVIIGGGTRKGANFTVKDISVVEIDSDNLVPEVENRYYDYRDDERNEFYQTSAEGTLWNSKNGGTPYVYDGTEGVDPHDALIYQHFVTNPATAGQEHSVLDAELYVPNYNFYGTQVSYVVISDPDYATADNEYGILTVGKNAKVNIELNIAATGFNTPNQNADPKINRIFGIGLRDPETKKVFWVEDGVYASFTNSSNATKKISATIDATKVGPEGKSYEGCEVVVIFGGQYAGGNARVWQSTVTIVAPPSVKEGAAASIRPEIEEGDLDKFGVDFEYKGYQSAGIRFSYTISDEKIANATDLGFVVAVEDLLSVDPYSEAWYDDAAVIKSSTFGKKYAEPKGGDTYMVTITGLTREGYEASLLDYYFFAAFYYVVDGVTTYVPVIIDGSECSSYGTVYDMYNALDEAGSYDAEVYGDLAWYEY